MYWPSKKPSVNDPEYKWIEIDWCSGSDPDADIPIPAVILYQQYNKHAHEYVEHYRLKVADKWVRKTFFGETAWSDVIRFAGDEWNAYFRMVV